MVRSRIGSHVAHEIAAETDALSGVSRRAPSLALDPWLEAAVPVRACSASLEHAKSPFAFIFEIVAPWIGRTARTVALGAMVALGGCGPRVEIDGVVRDGRTGEPIAGAHITTDDGRTLETDADGRFSMSAGAAERVVASASDRCDAAARVRSLDRPLTLRLFDRLELDREVSGELDAEVRIEVRARCDEQAPIEWRQIDGPALGPDRLRVEDRGRVLVVRTHSLDELVRLEREGELARGEYRFEASVPGAQREVSVRREAPALMARVRRSARAHDHVRRWLHGAHTSLASGAHAPHAPAATADAGAEDARAWCTECHGSDDGDPWAAASACTSCHDDAEWALSAMSRAWAHDALRGPALRSECVRCHDGRGFVEWQRRRPFDHDRSSAIDCATCHDSHEVTRPRGLRVFDHVEAIAGAPAEHLGSGAICASCHGASVESAPELASHAPQASVLLGRGARSVAAMDTGAHRFIADTCVRCHMTRPGEDDALRGRAGGHTFSIHAAGVASASACAPCHGSTVTPDAIGARDWDGDGIRGSVASEHDRAIERASELLRARVAALAIRGTCGRLAADVEERDARLVLIDAGGTMLGDCDADGAIEADEAIVTTRALPDPLEDAAHDLAMLRRDGSSGVHNPAYAFRVIAAVSQTLH